VGLRHKGFLALWRLIWCFQMMSMKTLVKQTGVSYAHFYLFHVMHLTSIPISSFLRVACDASIMYLSFFTAVNKRERFKNTLFGYTLWDMVINFGFQTKDDGSRECYHAGEYFHGNVPILSQVMLLIFKVHSRWVVWSTEHHVNHYAFSSGTTDEEEEMEEESRSNMPLFLLKNYAWSDLTAMLFGYKEGDLSRAEKQPSFLLLGGKDSEKDELPFQKKAIQIRISEDIEADKQAMKALSSKYCPEDVKKILARRATIARRRTNAKQEVSGDEDDVDVDEEASATSDVYVMATELAADRAMRRMTRRPTRAATN